MALQNAFGNIALDASVQEVKTAVQAITTTIDNGISVSGSVIALDAPTLAALETINANTGGLTDTQLRATPVPVSISGSIPVTIASAIEITNDDGNAIPVSGIFWQGTQPISAVSLPLPLGAATQTTLASIDTRLGATLSVNIGLTDAELRASPIDIQSEILDEIQNLSNSINTLVQFLYANSPRIDVAGRMTVNNSEITQAVSGTVTATVSNITAISGQPQQFQGQDVPLHIYDNIKVT